MSMLHEGDCLVRLDSIFVKRGEGGIRHSAVCARTGTLPLWIDRQVDALGVEDGEAVLWAYDAESKGRSGRHGPSWQTLS